MKRFLFSITTILLALTISFGQQMNANVSFEKLHHDYGQINEEKGPADYKFVFTNTGDKPLLIKNVKPSCGCTTSDYTKQPVPPGQKGFVTARYEPKNRPGRFNKSISVYTNSDNQKTLLRISGEVIPRPKTIEDLFPFAMNRIRLAENAAFTKVLNTAVKTKEIEFINVSEEPVKIEFDKIPAYITLKVIPSTIKPGEKGKINIRFDATKVNDFGFIYQKIIVKENGEINNKNYLKISAHVYEDFSHLTEEELANAPVTSFDKRIYNFGIIKQGELAKTTFVLKNTGKSDLIIRKTKATCGCTIVQPEKKVIKPGETTVIKATFNSRGRKGKQTKNITVTTNDPNNPVTTLKITGTVNLTAEQKQKLEDTK